MLSTFLNNLADVLKVHTIFRHASETDIMMTNKNIANVNIAQRRIRKTKADKIEVGDVELPKKSLPILKKAYKTSIRNTQESIILAREQQIISIDTLFKGFLKDIVMTIYEKKLKYLRKNIGMNVDNIVKRLTNSVVRGSFNEIIKNLKTELDIQCKKSDDLSELHYVRNCLIHNNKLVNKELSKIGTRFIIIGTKINLTEVDFMRYFNAVQQIAGIINTEAKRKYRI